MLVYYLALVASTLCFVVCFPTESIPVNDLSIGSVSPLGNFTPDDNLGDDLIYLETAGRVSVADDDMQSQLIDISADVNDFIGLIPISEVRAVISNYYRNDPEVRQGFSYMKEGNIVNRLLNVGEIKVLVQYLNETGLDVNYVLKKLGYVFGDVQSYAAQNQATSDAKISNPTDGNVSGGMHVMVDNILEVIPQDEVLNMFFEKMDNSFPFTTFFNNIREPKFGYLLQKLEDSAGIKYLIYDLHNHGINMEKIVDSLKNYFFLGTFN